MTEEKTDKKENTEQYVTKDMLIGEIVQKYPKAAFVMMQYGLHCVGCHVSAYETLEQGCLGHGMPEETLNDLLFDLNAFIAEWLETEGEDKAEKQEKKE